jgi:hypothetical protein
MGKQIVVAHVIVCIGGVKVVAYGSVVCKCIYEVFGGIKPKNRRVVWVVGYPAGAIDIFKRLLPGVSVECGFRWSGGLIVIVVNGHPQFILNFRGLSADSTVYVNVTIDYFDPFAGFAYQTFDVVLGWVKRILEDNDVPLFRLTELIDALEDEYAVSA